MTTDMYEPQHTTFDHAASFLHLPQPKLEFLFHLQCDMNEVLNVGKGPYGDRKSVTFTEEHAEHFRGVGGKFEGPKMRGTVLPGGGDWLLVKEDSTAYLDTRYNLQTHDGAVIYIQTHGVRKGPPDVLRRLYVETDVPPDQYSMRLQVTMETGDERYTWLNKAVVIASSARSGTQVIYDAYEVL